MLPSKTICSFCVSFILFSDTGVYRPTANGSSPNSILGVIAVAVLVVAFKDVLFDVVVGIAPPPPVVVLSAILGMLLLT